jgi:hypothetical protein
VCGLQNSADNSEIKAFFCSRPETGSVGADGLSQRSDHGNHDPHIKMIYKTPQNEQTLPENASI